MTARVYIAAPRQEVARARRVAEQLVGLRIELTSSWLWEYVDGEPDPPVGSEEAIALTGRQWLELTHMTDVLLALTADGAGRQTYVEIGIAHGMGIPIVWSRDHGGLALVASSSGVIVTASDYEAIQMTCCLDRELEAPR